MNLVPFFWSPRSSLPAPRTPNGSYGAAAAAWLSRASCLLSGLRFRHTRVVRKVV